MYVTQGGCPYVPVHRVSLNVREPDFEVGSKVLPVNLQHGEVSPARQLESTHYWDGSDRGRHLTHAFVERVLCTVCESVCKL